MKFKIISAVFVLALTFSGTCLADELIYPTGGVSCKTEVIYTDKSDVSSLGVIAPVTESNSLSFEERMTEQCLAHSMSVDVSDLGFTLEEISYMCMDVAMKHPELLILTQFGFEMPEGENVVLKVYPTYIFKTETEDDAARKLMNKEIEEYLEAAEPFDTPLEKLLAVHDELAEECDYADPNQMIYHHAYSIFAYEKAVCQGYSQAFYMLARELGIEAEYCVADEIGHSWNYVKLDDEWYHVDVTFDDPVTKDGKTVDVALHSNFLRSDDTIHVGTGYENVPQVWVNYLGEQIVCNSDKYESNYLFNLKMPFNIRKIGGKLCASCGNYYGGEIGNILFKYDNLHICEPMVVSEITNGKYAVYEPIAEVKNPPTYIKTAKSGSTINTGVVFANKEEYKGGMVYKLNNAAPNTVIKYMLLDLYEIKPLARAIVLE